MKTLKQYLEIENKIERLTEFLNDNGNWQNDYIDENEDYKNNYYDLIEIGTIYLDNCDYEIKELLQDKINKKGIDFLFDNDLISCEVTHGIYRINNELWSYNLGEIEVQFTGLYDHESKVNCVYSELIKDMTHDEIKESEDDCEFFISNDCLYIDRSYDRISFILDENKFLQYLKKD